MKKLSILLAVAIFSFMNIYAQDFTSYINSCSKDCSFEVFQSTTEGNYVGVPAQKNNTNYYFESASFQAYDITAISFFSNGKLDTNLVQDKALFNNLKILFGDENFRVSLVNGYVSFMYRFFSNYKNVSKINFCKTIDYIEHLRMLLRSDHASLFNNNNDKSFGNLSKDDNFIKKMKLNLGVK
jgi:hypothetical protein